jgi:hypothetical protein
MQGDFAVAAVLISMGALLGKVSATQLLWLTAFEVVFYAINNSIVARVCGGGRGRAGLLRLRHL